MKLSYLRTLQRAWDRYALPGEKGNVPRAPRARASAFTTEQKVEYLVGFMAAHRKCGVTIKRYEEVAGLPHGNMVTFTKWLMDGRLNVKPGELLDFFTARWAANKVVKREIAHGNA